MVLPGTFMPFFFPLGIAFMGSQSAVMMKMAGEQWQYGKRRISAMSNEDFNKLTPIKLFQIETSELRAMIPLMESSMKDMSALTPMIIKEMVKLVEQFVTTAPAEILRILGLEGVLTGQTPGELEYEKWLEESKTKDADTLTIPPPPGPKQDPPTEKEINEKLDNTKNQYEKLSWQDAVSSGQTLKGVKSALKVFEAGIATHRRYINNNPKSKVKVEKMIAITQQVIKKYKMALLWLTNNYPKKTP